MVDKLMFVEQGVIEVYTEFEGNEFILDTLYPGSIINQRSFLLEDLMSVSIRCKENSAILELTQASFQKILEGNENLKQRMMIMTDQILKQNKKFPLDYVISRPAILRPRRVSLEREQEML